MFDGPVMVSNKVGGVYLEEIELREKVAENRELETQLTKRNEQYIFDLKKSLRAANLSEDLQAIALNNILPELVEGQKTGKTARQLFGTITERTELILAAPEPSKASTKYQMWLDNSLMMFAFLSMLAGVLPMISKQNASTQQQGILTILIAAITGGYAFYLIYQFVYRYDRPGADQTGRPGTFKGLAIMVGIMLVWILIYVGTVVIPPSINITLEPVISVALAAVAFGVRYFLKNK